MQSIVKLGGKVKVSLANNVIWRRNRVYRLKERKTGSVWVVESRTHFRDENGSKITVPHPRPDSGLQVEGLQPIHVRVKNPKKLAILRKLLEKAKQRVSLASQPRPSLPKRIVGFDDIPLTSSMPNQKMCWIVEHVIAKETITLITAPPGSYKTWFALALADAVSKGKEFLGRKTIRTRTLYLDRDNPLPIICERRDILRFSEGEYLRFWGSWLGDLPPLIGDPRLLELAREYKPLIIVDSLRRFHIGDENSAKEMASVMADVRQLANAGAAVILLHHSPKSKQTNYRGSSDIHAGPELAFALSVETKTSPGVVKIECFKQRAIFAEEFEMEVRLNLDKARFEVVSDTASERSDKHTRKLKAIISETPGQSQSELLESSDLPEYKLRKLLHAGDGVHWKSRRGKGKTLHYHPL